MIGVDREIFLLRDFSRQFKTKALTDGGIEYVAADVQELKADGKRLFCNVFWTYRSHLPCRQLPIVRTTQQRRVFACKVMQRSTERCMPCGDTGFGNGAAYRLT